MPLAMSPPNDGIVCLSFFYQHATVILLLSVGAWSRIKAKETPALVHFILDSV